LRRLSSPAPTQSTCMRCTSSSSTSSIRNSRIIPFCTMNSHHLFFPARFHKLPTSPPIKSPNHLRVSLPPPTPPSVRAVKQNNAGVRNRFASLNCSPQATSATPSCPVPTISLSALQTYHPMPQHRHNSHRSPLALILRFRPAPKSFRLPMTQHATVRLDLLLSACVHCNVVVSFFFFFD
jgi:hypothetical protein